MTALSQQQIVVEKASSVSWRYLPGEPADEDLRNLVFVFVAALAATRRFQCRRSEQNCQRLSRNQVLTVSRTNVVYELQAVGIGLRHF
jgi:hypothetical protein